MERPHDTPREPDERLSAILESTDDAILAKDRDARITAWNAAAERLYGYSAEEAVGRSVAMIVPPESKGEEMRILRRVLAGESIERYETERVCKDGRRVTVSLTVSAVRDRRTGEIVGASVIARDVSAERATREALQRLAVLVKQSGDAIIGIDRRLRVIEWNPAAERLYGIAAEEALRRPAVELVEAPTGEDMLPDALQRALKGEVVRYEAQRRMRDGRDLVLSVTLSPIADAGGPPVGAVAVSRDVTRQRRREQHAEYAAQASRLLAESLDVETIVKRLTELLVPELADSCVVVRPDDGRSFRVLAAAHVDEAQEALGRHAIRVHGSRLQAGGVAAELRRTGRGVLVGDLAGDLPPALRCEPGVVATLRTMQARSVMFVPLMVRGDVRGELVLIAGAARRRYDADDLAFAEDLGARAGQALENARLYEALERAQANLRAAFEHAPTGIALARATHTGLDGLIEVNPALSEITGYTRDELLAMEYEQLLHPDDREAARQSSQWLLRGDLTHYNADRRYLHKSGHVVWVQVSAALYHRTADGAESVLQVQDVTERKRYEGQLQHLADHDALTGLFNRRRFVEELERVRAYTKRYAEPAAVLVLDIDNFKRINDRYGHPVGDQLLGALAHTLEQRSRETDVVGRLGGDEFGVILPRVAPAEAESTAHALLEAVRRRVSVALDGKRIGTSASVGVRLIYPGCDLSAAELLAEADIALYDAKETGRDRASVVGEGTAEPARVRSRLLWSERIRDALAGDRFTLCEQPILALSRREIERSELLIRMRSDDGDVIPPSVFLEIAHRFGQMRAIDRWVIGHAIALLAEREAAGYDLGLQVNLSGDSLTDERLMDFIAAEVRNAPIEPTRLTFEVTETVAIVNVERARALARRLSNLGCGLALDDFGSGFGSFYYLKHLPFDLVKIDGDFIRELPVSRTDQLTVQAIVQIAHGLGKPTVAEYVGDADTLELVERLGVDFAQGYYVGMPSPTAAAPRFLRSPRA